MYFIIDGNMDIQKANEYYFTKKLGLFLINWF